LIEVGAGYLNVSTQTLARLLWTLILIGVYFLIRIFIHAVVSHRVREVPKQYLLNKTLNYVLGFGVFAVAFIIWVGNVSGLAAYLGILSAGLAIALQDPLTNFAGWIFITIRKPFGVGDRIQIGGHAGDVIDMRLFQFTIVEIGNWVDADQSTGRIIHIPNGWVFKQSTANYAQGFNFIWDEIPVTITFESNWKKAKQILSDIAAGHAVARSDQAAAEIRKAARKFLIYFEHLTPIVWTSVADIGVTLTIRYICDPRKRRSSQALIWEEVLEAFAAAGDIDFAYPTTRFYDNVVEGKSPARADVT
jgi:small-conductance mechanosensitive channel